MEVEMKKGAQVTKLGPLENHLFMEKLITHIENDNLRLLQKQRQRTDRVGVKLPTIEVRFEHLSVEAECEVVRGKPLPTLWNSIQSIISFLTKRLRCKSQDAHLSILKDVSGVIKPSRLTLLLGPPGCGKTTLLMALAGKLNKSLKVTGDVSYNGYKLNEFVPEKTSAYVSQYDLHMPEMTVRETLDFSARCQGVGSRPGLRCSVHPDTVTVEPGTICSLANVIQTEHNFEFDHEEIMEEVSRREKEAGVLPDPDIDTYMKAISASGQKRNLQTDYVLKILGLDACADTMVGDGMRRGISGGQKKRLTTGEIVVGPIKTLFMDEISTGLDSSTTFQIVTCLQQMAHITDATIVVALLQPSPETFELFDDIILMAEGKILYHGPRSQVLQYFEDCGFKCPERKSVADFLQEVISEKDQAHLYCGTDHHHSYTTVSEFCDIFKSSVGEKLYEELSQPYDKSQCHKNALSLSTYSLSKWELFKACMDRELLLMKRNSFVYILKTAQLVIVALLTTTIFTRTRLSVNWLDANYYMGALFYTLVRLMLNGIAELSLIVSRLPVFYKQQAVLLYPAWAYAIPAAIIKIPFSLLESTIWTSITYYATGYSPEAGRFFCQIFLLFAVHAASTSLLRSIAAIFQTMVAATAFGFFSLIFMFLFGGFITSRPSIPPWLRWGFWISPMAYGEIGLSVNEFHAPRWQKTLMGNTTLGQKILVTRGLNYDEYLYWISIGALVGYVVLFDLVFLWALTYFKAPEMSPAIISKAKLSEIRQREEGERSAWDKYSLEAATPKTTAGKRKLGSMALPFEPLAMVFKDVQYFVDTPPAMGKHQKKLQLLQDITGAFRPGVLTAIMGVSGAGKTTLVDVLSGRKTGGTIEGDIRIGGYPKDQKTFARISGYCEQSDVHCPQLTVEESVTFSACLRLPPEVHAEARAKFVEEVMEIIELDEIKDSLVGIPGQSGLSTGQRKRLTIAVELVSNPSIIFMDEPTSGLDAREAAIVIHTVKNVVATGRTSVCTIHQPSIDIFEAFDELILMKKGGQVIYSGSLGHHSIHLKEYFEGITALPKLKEKINPATWMLEITSASVEAELSLDFAKIYKESPQYQEMLRLVRHLSKPSAGSKKLQFPTPFPQSSWGQYSACLWKQHLAYWRSPEYNLVRCMFLVLTGILFGAVFWQKGEKINNEQDLFNILGSMYAAVLFLGTNNCTLAMQYVSAQRTVMYREMFSGMYSSTAFSLAQVTIEIQYLLVQVLLYMAIVYPAMGFCWSTYKIFWFFYATFCTFLYFSYLGMLISSLSPNVHVGIILGAAVYTLLNLFSGFLIPGPNILEWLQWSYWMCPTSWSLNALLTSQYGDMDTEVMVFGENKPVGSFLKEYYGYRPDRLGVAAVALFAFPVIFASLFAFFTRKLNFQQR